ncbi:protein CHROMATIN REMODELING 25 [Lathyrus oleraceus]|uniref:Protein CHROMATIN REMODELING 25, variant 2 n=1 Tax=Pisum sativum TaxID=3888 RepID=A0A9D4XM81_PEA|nr:protein CHROMATIN REMODELING 25 [Pisum sativum]KAI5423599.1 Protein CHROMATIN REMODELING 25, variant 2 [Pisum sativum]
MEDQEELLSSSSSDFDSDSDSGDSEIEVEQLKSQNVEALVKGNLIVKRQSLLPRVLSVGTSGAAVCRKPFKPPSDAAYTNNQDLSRRLSARKRFVPWGSTTPIPIPIPNPTPSPLLDFNLNVPLPDEEPKPSSLPPGIDPLVLWQPPHEDPPHSSFTPISVDTLLVRFLRPHQREGVQFMFDCVAGLCDTPDINGCILADDMGLGKTLQSITLLYTLICQGFHGNPMVTKAIIVTPTSLVSNWEAEIKKWVGERIRLVALCETTREDVISGINSFTSPRSNLQVLIVSYETFRMHSSKFIDSGSCDLLICDEAHRLKNDQTITNRALAALPCKRRVLLSGTPLQNDLDEFFAMVNFTNPGVLGPIAHFRRYFEAPIICGREPAATAEEKKLGAERTAELSAKVNQFILRRTNALLSNHLPPKIVEVVCCKLTPLQSDLYKHFIQSKNVKRVINEEVKQSKILAYITALKKLCNHPKLIYDTIRSGSPGTSGFENCIRFFPPNMSSGRSGSWTGGHGGWVELSGKMQVLARLLAQLRQRTNDRIVLVSNYTQTLDLFAQLCREQRYPHLRLDGATSISKRQKLVNCLNDPSKDEFVFLLSSKAGGCGLNLIGANRLVLFDPDWNPANDKQAAARVWRDGQKKRVYIYRFLSAGTIEEKVYQRQMSKEGLQKVIQREQNDSVAAQGNFLSTEDLRNLFTFDENVKSDIHENMRCSRCQTYDDPQDTDVLSTMINSEHDDDETSDIGGFAEIAGCLGNLKRSEKQVGNPLEEDLSSWGHHFFPTSVPDGILQASAGDEVTFVFTNQVDGKLVPVDSISPKVQKKELHRPRRNVERKSTPFSLHNKLVPLRSASHSSSIAWKKEATNCERITKKVDIDVALNTEHSLVNEISGQKRSCPADINDEHSLLNEVSQKKTCHVVISDDDFE